MQQSRNNTLPILCANIKGAIPRKLQASKRAILGLPVETLESADQPLTGIA